MEVPKAEKVVPPTSQFMTRDDEDDVIPLGSMPPIVQWVNLFCFPLNLLCGWMSVGQKQVVVTEYCGVVTQVHDTPGLYREPCCCRVHRPVTTAVQTMDLPNTKIVDSGGTPLLVSAIVNYQVAQPLQAIYSVQDYVQYVNSNAQAVVKSVVSEHSYDQLKNNTNTINAQLQQEMAQVVRVAGVRICSVALNELYFAPEIAASMLKKQAAGAVLEARQLIVTGAVQMAQDAVRQLEENSTMTLNDRDKVTIVTNLLTVTCSDSDAQPTISVG